MGKGGTGFRGRGSDRRGAGFPAGGSIPGGSFSPLPNAGTPSLGFGQQGSVPGQFGSAIDPNVFSGSGMAKMNLPIVGVVDCESKESIRMYMGQTWYSQWAFTPLAQGQFAGTVPTGGGNNTNVAMPRGLGMSGAEAFDPKDRPNPIFTGTGRNDGTGGLGQRMGNRGPGRSWRRGGNDDAAANDPNSGSNGKKRRRGGTSASDPNAANDPNDDYYDDDYDDDYDDSYDDPDYDDDGSDEEDNGSGGGGLSASAP